jgi:hypothetical protein
MFEGYSGAFGAAVIHVTVWARAATIFLCLGAFSDQTTATARINTWACANPREHGFRGHAFLMSRSAWGRPLNARQATRANATGRESRWTLGRLTIAAAPLSGLD